MKKIICIFAFIVSFAGFVCLQIFYGEGGQSLGRAKAAEEQKICINSNYACTTGVLSAILVEAKTGAVLYEKQADEKLPMASMTKLMAIRIAFDEIESGRLHLDDKVTISKNAADQIGSEAFLDFGAEYLVEDLLRCMIIVSANDATVALAEAVCGSEEAFVSRMNQKAATLDMTSTHFSNSTGLPAAGHFSTARDMAILTKNVVFEQLYKKYSKTYLDELIHPSGRKTSLVATNRQMKNFAGFEGGKTGHTNEAGYCFAAGAKRGDMQLVSVVFGGTSSEKRFDATKSLLEFGFDNFKTKEVVKTTKSVGKFPIAYGNEKEIEVFAKESFVVFMQKSDKIDFKFDIEVTATKAPIELGQKVGTLKVWVKDEIVFETDLVTAKKYDHIGLGRVFVDLLKAF